MRLTSPTRRASWTKHTSYPTAFNERAPQVPAEVSLAARASNKQAENDLTSNSNLLTAMHRKSIGQLDRQRKLLQKSMLAYSKKVKELTDERTNQLFREIHTRNASRVDSRSKSPASKSTTSAFSLPARFYNETAECNFPSLRDIPSIQIHSPILESRSLEATPDLYKKQGHSGNVRSARNKSNFEKFSTESKIYRKSEISSANISKQYNVSESTENRNQTEIVKSDDKSTTKQQVPFIRISPKVAAGSLSIPWFHDSSDSAYSSASEDIDNELSDDQQDGSSVKSSKTNSTRKLSDTSELLTVPTMHIRRRNKKTKRRSQGSELLEHALIQRQQSVLNLKSDTYL